MRLAKWSGLSVVAGLIVFLAGYGHAVELTPSFFDQDLLQIRYSSAASITKSNGTILAVNQAGDEEGSFEDSPVKEKSPFKAFALSAILPGAGQFYNGSKIKPLLFLGAEVAAWGFHFKYHGEGDDATDAYQQYNHDHWSRFDYEQKYLLWAYGVTDDDLVDARELSHHLPDEQTQQYYEMTGKYNQFAWGWDDALLRGDSLESFGPGTMQPITGDSTTPSSARRMIYEGMRDDANSKYDRADKMIMIAIVNRLFSGFEAFFSARKINQRLTGGSSTFSRIDVDVSLKSYHARRDTPYMKLTYKF